MPGRRRKIHRLIKLYYLIILLIYLLDQFSKFYILKVVQQGSSTPVINNILHITLVQNTGAAFGMLKEHPSLFIVIAIIAVFLIVFFLVKKSHALNIPEKIALSFILGGTLGNLTDRVRFGHVIDFIDLRVWPVFNIADSFITIGAIVLGVSVLMDIRRRSRKNS